MRSRRESVGCSVGSSLTQAAFGQSNLGGRATKFWKYECSSPECRYVQLLSYFPALNERGKGLKLNLHPSSHRISGKICSDWYIGKLGCKELSFPISLWSFPLALWSSAPTPTLPTGLLEKGWLGGSVYEPERCLQTSDIVIFSKLLPVAL